MAGLAAMMAGGNAVEVNDANEASISTVNLWLAELSLSAVGLP